MQRIRRYTGITGLLFYLSFLYVLWHFAKYGDVAGHLPWLTLTGVGCVGGWILWAAVRKKAPVIRSRRRRLLFAVELTVFCVATVWWGKCIADTAVPYRGALSWKIDAWRNEKEVPWEHRNFFEGGVDGILQDLRKKVDVPEKLYVSDDGFHVVINKDGMIQRLETFLYGRDEQGVKHSLLISYDAGNDRKIHVRTNGVVGEADENYALEPMIRILGASDYKERIEKWAKDHPGTHFAIDYFGRRSFDTTDGVEVVSDISQSEARRETGEVRKEVAAGGQVTGFEVSLSMPEETPVRYIMNPEVKTGSAREKEHGGQQDTTAKEADTWVEDPADGSLRFFLTEQCEWKLSVADAAAGSRLYRMERTVDGGKTWDVISENPFDGKTGVAEGLEFVNETVGFAGLSGASGTHSTVYRTSDGGVTWTAIRLPMGEIRTWPATMQEYGLKPEDYKYAEMPVKQGNRLTIRVLNQAGETDGPLFVSRDDGKTWTWEK